MNATPRTSVEAFVRQGFRRVLATIVGVVLVLGLLLTAFSSQYQRHSQLAALEAFGRALTRSYARLASVPLQDNDLEEVKKLTEQTQQVSGDVRYAAVLKVDGTVVDAAPQDYERPTDFAEVGELEHRVVDGIPVLHFAAPVLVEGKQVYVVHVGVDESGTLAQIARLQTISGLGTALAVLLCALLVSLQMRRVGAQLGVFGQRLREAVSGLSSWASDMAELSRQTEANSMEEAAAVDQTRLTMTKLVEGASDITEATRAVLHSAERTSSASESIARRIETLSSQALKISGVADSIQTIADKSDMLALNASLEGAKAGEAGKGFVLVAAEMRRLSEMVLGAAREIRTLSDDIQQLSQVAILAAEDGKKLSVETTRSSRIISTITDQQRSATAQVTLGMDDVQRFTQQSATGAKQVKDTADRLVTTARSIGSLLDGAGDKAATRSGRR